MGSGARPHRIDRVMPHRYLMLQLESPMVAFGDTMIDSRGPIRETPSTSAISGLLGNALGFRREQSARLSRMQERIVFGCRLDHVDTRLTDFQTAQLNGKDRGWTTSGAIQERAGGANTFDSPHIRERDYDSNVRIVLALRLRDAEEQPTIDDLAHAVQWPARPLFLGRKCCLPSAPIFDGFVEAEDAMDALLRTPVRARRRRSTREEQGDRFLVTLPADEACPDGFETVYSTEWRDWPAGVHAGEQRRFRGTVERARFATEATA
ncbi:MAG: type I-E CRISPR-associated protein Cas5/CasD [bacterium]